MTAASGNLSLRFCAGNNLWLTASLVKLSLNCFMAPLTLHVIPCASDTATGDCIPAERWGLAQCAGCGSVPAAAFRRLQCAVDSFYGGDN
eukprot:CAMPEP_0206147384 /NCGR_PEP_ID=MMETSP1473-20131121/33274_1 /ASSEMBLY_ACC=CAM_ASM_001109 /TAXON_ID=1461547 /ORGANISM="Stichococcus sp, Strain RCC1054" /LENGTH=89 /DNA_ID=CAMNT_0053544287 /DNA_START=124 /DNA_END=393 /DNA_ORIENTATION=+